MSGQEVNSNDQNRDFVDKIGEKTAWNSGWHKVSNE